MSADRIKILGRTVGEQFPILQLVTDLCVLYGQKYGAEPDTIRMNEKALNEWRSAGFKATELFPDLNLKLIFEKKRLDTTCIVGSLELDQWVGRREKSEVEILGQNLGTESE